MSMMQVLIDTQVEGRFFPQGSHVQAFDVGDSYLVLPDLEAYTTLCLVPAKNLARLTRFRVVLVNRRFGLIDKQERWGLDEDDVRSSIARHAPDCEILELDEVFP